MKQTSKVFLGLGVVLLLIIVGGILFLYSNLGGLVASIIATEGTEATQTPVKVGSVSIDLGAGTAGISSLTIANPEGFSDQPAISLEGFSITLDPMAVTEDPLVISEITVDGAHLLIEQARSENNLKTILSSVQRLSDQEQQAPESAGKKVIIERFELTGTRARLLVPQLDQAREVEMPDITLTDIGRDTNGATAATVARQILEPIIRKALESAATSGVRDAIEEKLDDSGIPGDLLDRFGDGSGDKDESGNR